MPCAAGELCKLADVELIAPNGRNCGHACRGGCGGKLHGICGEVEDPDGDSPTHRICHTCISNRSLSNSIKRKQGQGFVLPGASKNKSDASGAKKLRKRLNLGERLKVLELLDNKVSYAEIARRYGYGTTAVGTVESVGGRKLMAPPSYLDLSGRFGSLEQFAQSAGNTEAGYFLREAKMSFLSAHAAKPSRQADMRMFLES